MPKIRGSRDRRDWAGTEKHNLAGKPIPNAPGWKPEGMTGEELVRWAEWAGVEFRLERDGELYAVWDGPKPTRILEPLVPYREEIVRYLKGEAHPFL